MAFLAKEGTVCLVCGRVQRWMTPTILESAHAVEGGWVHDRCEEARLEGKRWIFGLECPEMSRPLSEMSAGDRSDGDRRDTGHERPMVASQLSDGGDP